VPTAESVKLVPVALLDQVTVPAQPDAVKVRVEGAQTTNGFGGVIVGAPGFAFISRPVTAELASEVQPLTVQVAVIEYVPTVERVRLVPVALFDQVTIPAQPLAVKVRVEGAQTTNGFGGVIVGELGLAFISSPVTAELASEVQPLIVQVAVME